MNPEVESQDQAAAAAAPSPLQVAVLERVKAKRAEDAAVGERRAADKKIAQLLPLETGKTKGTVSTKLLDISLKVAVEYGINYTVDAGQLNDVWAGMPDNLRACFRYKPEVVPAAYEALSAEDKLKLAPYITSKPASPSVKLEVC